MLSVEKPREIAVRLLGRRSEGDYIETLLDRALEQTRLNQADRALCRELVLGITRWRAALDWLIARKTAGRVQKAQLQNLLRLGLYQIFWLDRIPDHAAVNETVDLARALGFGPQAGFVNAMLRGYLREADATRAALTDLKRSDPALGHSHPSWLVERWRRLWGDERSARLLEWNNTPPKVFARVNALKADPGKLLEQWRSEGVEYDFVARDWLPEALVFELKRHPPIFRLPSFLEGRFYIQDPSTLLAVSALDPRPGETILDLCSAPGGKLTFMAQLMGNQGRIVAHDPAPQRLQLVVDNCKRLGVTCALPASFVPGATSTEGAAGLAPSPNPAEPSFIPKAPLPTRFDRILIDAPCSNTGVIRRRVDLRWRLRAADIESLRQRQIGLLRLSARLLNPGGRVVYSTCSLEPEENEQVIDAFVKEWPGWHVETQRGLTPFDDNVDGAFVARLSPAK